MNSSGIKSDISEVEEALLQGLSYEKLIDLHRKIDCKYHAMIPDIGSSMWGYNSEYGFNYELIDEDSIIDNLKSLKYKLEGLLLVDSGCNQTYSKPKKLFISHAGKDKEYVTALVDLLISLGLTEKEVVCSSVPGFGIEYGADIYDWLRNQFIEYDLHVLFILSHNYYNSAACLNEMGAAWIIQNKSNFMLLPHFDYPEIDGAVNPRQMGMKFDGNEIELKHRLWEFVDGLVKEFDLHELTISRWERIRDPFLRRISEIQLSQEESVANDAEIEMMINLDPKLKKQNQISIYACVLLVYAAEDNSGQIMMIPHMGGTSISAGRYDFVGAGGPRVVARWADAVEQLLAHEYIRLVGRKDKIFSVTESGYVFAEQVKTQMEIDVNIDPDVFLEKYK